MFGSILVLWEIQLLVPEQIRAVSNMGSLSWHEPQVGSIIDWPPHNFCATFIPAHLVDGTNCGSITSGWVGVPVPPLEVLPGYRRWPVQPLYLLILVDISRVTLIDYRDFLVQ